uniref:Venom S1 protease 9 n=1 Tax=Ectomocoris sp. TaxID=3104572 RepID=A0AB38ZE71_9HEMI
MKIWLTIIGLLLVYSTLTLAGDDDDDGDDGDDEDSSEYGVVDGEKGTNCTCGTANKEGQRIIGGEEAKKNEWPMIAEFSVEGNHFCGGTLITKRHVITAAHCGFFPKSLDPLPYERIDVYLGAHEVSGERAFEGARMYAIEEFRAHPKYHFIGKRFDIAVVLLDDVVDSQNGNAVPACFPVRADYKDGDEVNTLGWGAMSYGAEEGASTLMKVKLKIVAHAECKKFYLLYDQTTQICMYAPNKDACQGDSGGPHLYRDPETNRYTLVGATSYGKKCGIMPGVNANIVLHRQWLLQTISDTDPKQKVCSKVD